MKKKVIDIGYLFFFSFKEQECLWRVCEKLSEDCLLCRIESGCFMGKVFGDFCVGQEAKFHKDHIEICSLLDRMCMSLNMKANRKRIKNGKECNSSVDRSLSQS